MTHDDFDTGVGIIVCGVAFTVIATAALLLGVIFWLVRHIQFV